MTGEPKRIASGKFALYQTPKGGAHLTLAVDGEETPRHIEIPAMMVKMMMRKAKETSLEDTQEMPAITENIIEFRRAE